MAVTRERCCAAACCLASLCYLLPAVCANSCTVDVNKDLARQEPVLVVDGELAIPHGNTTAAILFPGAAVVACPGRRNRLSGLGRQEVDVRCRSGSTVTLAGRSVPLRDLSCSIKLSPSLEVSSQTCGQGAAVVVHIGYQVGGTLYDLMTACHDTDQVSTLYTQHVLHGSGIGGRQAAEGTPSFESGSLNRGFSIARLYRQATVTQTLTQLLGSKTLADRYTTQTFISRGHLSPRADFILQAYQNATFFYVNVAPQWQSVNRGNWLHVEDSVRRHAQRHGYDLVVTTGTHAVMTLPNQQGRPREVYLNGDGRLPVPKFLWKVVYQPDSKSAIAFITVNNPFLGPVADEDLLCEDLCRDYGWEFSSQSTVTLGYTYCCEVGALRRVVGHVPSIKVNSVLRNR